MQKIIKLNRKNKDGHTTESFMLINSRHNDLITDEYVNFAVKHSLNQRGWNGTISFSWEFLENEMKGEKNANQNTDKRLE